MRKGTSSRRSRFLAELKRRNVYRVAAAYLAVGVAISLAVPDLFAAFELPTAAARLVIVLVAMGFPVALVLAWAYEVRPEEPEAVRAAEPAAPAAPSPRSRIAVLPFASIHPDREHDYFADGLTEELISALARIQGLDVIARTSVMRYRDSGLRVADIARELGVGCVLEGSVRKAGDQLRITTQLIDGVTEGHLWTEDYDREFREIFKVQGDIAHQVADALELRLFAEDHRKIERPPTSDLEAYDLYLLGRHQLNRRNDEGTRKAIAHFQAALARDPEFAEARAGLADAHLLGAMGFLDDPPPYAVERARAEAEQALALDEELPEAHTSRGYAATMLWDSDTAERSFRRAIELNPSHAQAHQWYAHHLSAVLKRHQAGIREFQRALELDPLSVVLTTESGWPYGYLGDHQRAIERFEKALEMDPDFGLAHYDLGWAYQRLGKLEEAIDAYERARELLGKSPFVRAFLATAYAEAGREADARAILEEFVGQAEREAPVALFAGMIHGSLGETDSALGWLERAVDAREPLAASLATGDDWLVTGSLQADPRFHRLVSRVDELLGRTPQALSTGRSLSKLTS